MREIDNAEPFKFTPGPVMRTARKTHLCDECRRIIKPGETYEYLTGISGHDSDGWGTFRTCQHCLAAGTWIEVVCGGYPVTSLRDELETHRDEFPDSTALGPLKDGIESRWHAGVDPVPDVEEIKSDAQRCLALLTA